MTLDEAYNIAREFEMNRNPGEDDEFMYTEALDYIITETGSDRAMLGLGGHYYGKKDYDLALKYYDMAAMRGNLDAYNCLGYIWYYGRTGTKDYKKAFECFQKASEMGDVNSAYKMADMYKNGYYVEKDYDKYVSIIESLYPRMTQSGYYHFHTPEIYTRLAGIREKQGRNEEAADLLTDAKSILAQRIEQNPFFGDLSIMSMLIESLYRVTEFDPLDFDLYDLYYVLKTPAKVTFKYKGRVMEAESVTEEGGIAVCFGGKWFRTVNDFFLKAEVDGRHVTDFYADYYLFEVE